MVGGSLHFGKDVATGDFRAYGSYLYDSTKRGEQRLFFGLGGIASYGVIGVKDPRGIDGTVGSKRFLIGPEFRLGTAWLDKEPYRAVDLYLAFAPLFVYAPSMSDRTPERGGAFGTPRRPGRCRGAELPHPGHDRRAPRL
jgi:hypothetical protein